MYFPLATSDDEKRTQEGALFEQAHVPLSALQKGSNLKECSVKSRSDLRLRSAHVIGDGSLLR